MNQCPSKTYLKQSEINRKVTDDIYKTNRQNNEQVEEKKWNAIEAKYTYARTKDKMSKI